MRVACVLVPQFPVAAELVRRPELAGRPLVVGGLPHQRLPVLGCSPEAAAFGIAPGMPIRRAQGLCPEAVFLPADDELYGRTRALLLRTLGRFSPRVEALPPAPSLTAYLDASGLDMLFGPDQELGARIAAALEEEAGLRPRVAVAGGKFVARAAALQASPGSAVVVPPGGEAVFLAPLPVGLIPCSREMSRRLALFGLHTLGQLAALPPGALAEQFGSEGVAAARLARGDGQELLSAGEAPPVLEEGVELDPPTEDHDRLKAAAGLLLDQLTPRLSEGFLACTMVSLRLSRPDDFEIHLTTTLHEAASDRPPLERAVDRLLGRVEAAGRGPGGGAQGPALHSSLAPRPSENRGESVFSHLALCLSGFAPREDEQTELIASRASNLKKVRRAVRRAEEQFGGAIRPLGEMAGEKPLPCRIGASMDRNGRPAILFLEGRPDRVVEVCNRWRVAGDWWRREIVRDYYRLITQSGRLCLVFQDLTDGSWRLERIYE